MTHRMTIIFWDFRLGQISHTICWGAKGLEEGWGVKITLIVSCLEWPTFWFLFIMVEYEKALYSPDLKMVLIFLLQKSSKRLQCSNEHIFNSHELLSHNGQRQDWWPECVQPPPPPGKLAAQLKLPFGLSSRILWVSPLSIEQWTCT